LPIIPYIFSILAGDKPSDDTDGNFGDTTPKAAQDNDLLAESMITLTNFETANNTPVNSPQLYPTYELPSITITTPTESIGDSSTSNTPQGDTSNTSSNTPQGAPTSNSPQGGNSPTRTFSSGSFNE
jgi:hypothetical protein